MCDWRNAICRKDTQFEKTTDLMLLGALSRERYVMITHTWPVAAARAFATLAPCFNFVYISGEGATQTPSFMSPFFARTKGDAETSLLQLSNVRGSGVNEREASLKSSTKATDRGLQCYSVRLGFVDAAGHDEIRPYVPQPPLSYTLSAMVLGPVIRNFIPSMYNPTSELGKVLVQLGGGKGISDEDRAKIDAERILNKSTIQRLVTNLC